MKLRTYKMISDPTKNNAEFRANRAWCYPGIKEFS